MYMNFYPRYENSNLENYIGEPELVKTLSQPIEKNIVITGGVGTGKTHLAYALINKYAEKKQYDSGRTFYTSSYIGYANIKQIIDNIKKLWSKDCDSYDYKTVEEYKTIPLLIIDEIGVQYGTESERIELYEIINSRYNNMLPTISISNFNREQMEKTLGLRIVDRLYSDSLVFELKGKSRR